MVYDLLNSWGHEGYEVHCEKYVLAFIHSFISDLLTEQVYVLAC